MSDNYLNDPFNNGDRKDDPPKTDDNAPEQILGEAWVSQIQASVSTPSLWKKEEDNPAPGQTPPEVGSGYCPKELPPQYPEPSFQSSAPQQTAEQGWGSPVQQTAEQGWGPPVQQKTQPDQQYSTANGWQQVWEKGSEEGKGEKPPRDRKRKRGPGIVLAALGGILAISLVVLAGFGAYSILSGNALSDGVEEAPGTVASQPQENISSITLEDVPRSQETLVGGKLVTEDIVEKVLPSVVAVTTYADFRNFQSYGMGSGIIIREDGYIVTNAHVVEGASGISVQLSQGDVVEARLVAADSRTDLAVLKMDGNGYPAATFGNSTQIRVGEKVLAIGNPQSMDFYGSVTQGIISGLNRRIKASSAGGGSVTNYVDLIQTDAAINPGNSGGALVNEYGQVIGVNSAKVVATGAEGMGFAIPANDVKRIVDDLIQYQRVTGRARLGVTVQEVNQVYANYLGTPTGLGIMSTEENSDISKKGVIPGDIITKVDGEVITGMGDLTEVLGKKKPGETVDLELYRMPNRSGQKPRTFNVTVELLEDLGTPVPQPQDQAQGQTPPGFPPGGLPNSDGGNNGNNGGNGNNSSEYPSDEELQDFFNRFFN